MMRYRVGRHLGRTIYRQLGDEPSDQDALIGMMDTRADAEQVVAALNQAARLAEPREHVCGPDTCGAPL
jgi:hypothetical protein